MGNRDYHFVSRCRVKADFEEVLERYRRHEISSGKAAELLGTTRVDFIRRASDAGIPFFDMDGSELDDEIRRAVSQA